MVQLVKLGGSVITEKGSQPTLREGVLDRLASEVAEAEDDVVVVHGAGSFGHPLALEHGLAQGAGDDTARAALTQVHADVRQLNLHVLGALREAGLHPVTLSPFGTWACNDGNSGGWNLVPVHRMLGHGLTPVSHGDIVLDTKRGTTVLSGDTIVAELARFLMADRVVFAVDVDGAYSHPPDQAEAKLLERPTPDELDAAIEEAGTGEGPDVTGGMAGKLEHARTMLRSGVEVCLTNGLEPGRVADALAGKPSGTILQPGGDDR